MQDYKPVGKIGGCDCKVTMWISDSSFACLVPPGSGNVPISVDVQKGLSNPAVSARFRYLDPPVITAVAAVPWQTQEVNRSITITGRNFGTTPTLVSVMVGGTQAISSSWISETQVVAIISPGAGRDKDLFVQVYVISLFY